MYVNIPAAGDLLVLAQDWSFELPKVPENRAFFERLYPQNMAAWEAESLGLNITFEPCAVFEFVRVVYPDGSDARACIKLYPRDGDAKRALSLEVPLHEVNRIEYAPGGSARDE